MALREAGIPAGVLYHIGRGPDPLAWTDWEYVGEGRFDGPRQPQAFRALNAAEQRLACFVETLEKWRPSVAALADLARVVPIADEDDASAGTVGILPEDWHFKRMIGTLRLLPDQRWLDLREHETRETLRARLAPMLRALGYKDFGLGDAMSRDRRLSKAIARLAVDDGFHGIAYTSRFDHAFDCWAIFEGARFQSVNRRPILRDDEDLLEAVRRLNLTES